MNRKLLFKKKHLFCLIPLLFLLVIILGGIIVLALLYIGFSWKNKKMRLSSNKKLVTKNLNN